MSTSAESFLEERLTTVVGQPLRVAVYSRVAAGIRNGVFPLGTVLPRETELGAALGVSRTVVREALMLLEEDGLIVTKRGVGRFVADSIPHVGLEEFRPFEKVLGDPGSPIGVRVLEFMLQQTTDFISSRLALDSAANTWFRESLLTRGDQPIAIIQEHLPAGRYLSDISPSVAENLEAAAKSEATLLAALIDRCGPVFSAGVCQIAANVAGPTRAQLLDLKPRDPVLVLTQTAEVSGTPTYLAKCIVAPQVGNLSVMQSGPN